MNNSVFLLRSLVTVAQILGRHLRAGAAKAAVGHFCSVCFHLPAYSVIFTGLIFTATVWRKISVNVETETLSLGGTVKR
jgi:hypothetical protein